MKPFILVFLLVVFPLFFIKDIHLINTDLGRHLKNGEYLIEKGVIVTDNFYSFSHPEYKTINHHWLAGGIFYLIYKYLSFNGLTIIYALLASMSLLPLILYFYKKEAANFFLLAVLLTTPLLATRAEIRPEIFSYVFATTLWFLCQTIYDGRSKTLWVLPAIFLLQAIWVNVHIFFVFGLVVSGCFAASALATKNKNSKKLAAVFLLSIAATFINPYGISGALYPLNILKEYGYMIAENQPIFFMQKRFPSFVYLHAEIYLLAMLLSLICIKRQMIRQILPTAAIIFIAGILAFRYIRAIPMYGYFFIAYASLLFENPTTGAGLKNYNKYITAASSFVLLLSLLPSIYFSPFDGRFGVGYNTKEQASSEFIVKNNIQGPIFNNYDIGGYLIFNLFPRHRVFVDNRPEAYPVDFFTRTYIPMQEDENIWKEADNRYKFNAIYFYRHDITPWAQPFLIRRLNGPGWTPVFVDDFTIVLLKNNAQNAEVISKYRLPPKLFKITR